LFLLIAVAMVFFTIGVWFGYWVGTHREEE